MKRSSILLFVMMVFAVAAYLYVTSLNPNPAYTVGQKLDSLNGVYVYYNGAVSHTGKRNLGSGGYNIGLSYQCVEFVKRYYYEFYKHKMPDTYGHARDFYDARVRDGGMNSRRGLIQFSNPGSSGPQIGDLLVFDGHSGNPYGHVAIVADTGNASIEVLQQNPGPFAASRITLPLIRSGDKFRVDHSRLLGWLRLPAAGN